MILSKIIKRIKYVLLYKDLVRVDVCLYDNKEGGIFF